MPREHFSLVGRNAEEQQVRVAQQILSKYVGLYDFDGSNRSGYVRSTLHAQAVRKLQWNP